MPIPPPERKKTKRTPPRKPPVVLPTGSVDADELGILQRQFVMPRPQVAAEDPMAALGLVRDGPGFLPPPPPKKLTMNERDQFRALIAEVARRDKESLRLFEPMPEQERFFASHASERIALGGNRGGKTTVTCVEIARAVTGQDPHDKYPREAGRFVLVGKDLTHCSKVFYRKLFRAGAFRIIRDDESGEWRTFKPDDPRDVDRYDESEPAPPLIPSRFIKSMSWENKKEEIPKTITLKNNWELCFFSSLGAPPQGWDIDGAAFDEEIEHPLWYQEMSARLLDRRRKNRLTGKVKSGKFIWSATPQAGTMQLYALNRRAETEHREATDDAGEGKEGRAPSIECFRFGLLKNEFISEDAKQDFIHKLRDDPDEYRVRVLGDFALIGSRVYGEFSPYGAHGCESFPVPPDWTWYASVDPGRQVCAILFAAVPPPSSEHAGQCFLVDELYIKKANAELVAAAIAARLGGRHIEKWYIDARGGRITEIGTGITPEEQYRRSFVRAGIFSKPGPLAVNPTGFIWSTASGGDDIKAGIEAVRLGLHLDHDGRSYWKVFRDKCKNFLHEAELYSYKRQPSGLVTDEILKSGQDHLMDNWRYLACAKLRWARPRPGKRAVGSNHEALARKKAKAQKLKGFGGSVKLG